MTGEDIKLVKDSFNLLKPRASEVAEKFYINLFHLYPETKVLFKGNMEKQGQMLMSALTFAVRSLDNPAAIENELVNLGNRHFGYGVKREDYNKVGIALLKTLEESFEKSIWLRVNSAWGNAFNLIYTTMVSNNHYQN